MMHTPKIFLTNLLLVCYELTELATLAIPLARALSILRAHNNVNRGFRQLKNKKHPWFVKAYWRNFSRSGTHTLT